MKCPHCGIDFTALKTRERILQLLKKPLNVTQLKKRLPEVSSFGTLAYHLKILREKKLVVIIRKEKKQGGPTFYVSKGLSRVRKLSNVQRILVEIREDPEARKQAKRLLRVEK